MDKSNVVKLTSRDTIIDPLTELLRTGAEQLIYQAVAYSPLSATVLSLSEIKEMVDELFAVNEPYLPPQFT